MAEPLSAMERIAAAEARATLAEKRILDLELRTAQTLSNQVEIMRALGNTVQAVVGLQSIVCVDDDGDATSTRNTQQRAFGKPS